MDSLPDEIILHILSFIPMDRCGGIFSTCTRFRNISHDSSIKKKIRERRIGNIFMSKSPQTKIETNVFVKNRDLAIVKYVHDIVENTNIPIFDASSDVASKWVNLKVPYVQIRKKVKNVTTWTPDRILKAEWGARVFPVHIIKDIILDCSPKNQIILTYGLNVIYDGTAEHFPKNIIKPFIVIDPYSKVQLEAKEPFDVTYTFGIFSDSVWDLYLLASRHNEIRYTYCCNSFNCPNKFCTNKLQFFIGYHSRYMYPRDKDDFDLITNTLTAYDIPFVTYRYGIKITLNKNHITVYKGIFEPYHCSVESGIQ